jgi:hypothetical protein
MLQEICHYPSPTMTLKYIGVNEDSMDRADLMHALFR